MNKNRDKIAILTDSACNIQENMEKHIFVVPLYVVFKECSKKDLVEIQPVEIYSKIDTETPRTAAPSIDDFKEKINYIKKLGYEKIIGISLTSKFSGTYNSMRLALENSDMEYKIFDSKTVSVGASLLIEYGSRLIRKGMEFEEVYRQVKEKRKDIRFFAVVNDLKYLIRGGRISNIKGIIGSILKITPILAMDKDGSVMSYKSVRGKDKAIKYLSDLVKKDLDNQKNYYISLSYANDINDISQIKSDIKNYIENSEFYYETELTSVLGCHTGPYITVVSYLII